MRAHSTLMFAVAVASAGTAQAETDEGGRYFTNKHVIALGAAYQDPDAKLRATSPNLPDVTVELDDLNVDDSDLSWALEYRWRFSPRWMLSVMAYTFDNEGRRGVERDFNFDGVEFKAGAEVQTSLDVDTYIVDVLYRVYRSKRAEIMLGGGLHAFDLEAAISGRAFIGGSERESATGSSDLLAPLPNLRAQATYQFKENWGAYIAAGWLSASYDEYDGSFAYIHARLGYWFNEHWGTTLGYQFVDIDLTQERSRGREIGVDINFKGPTMQLHYRF